MSELSPAPASTSAPQRPPRSWWCQPWLLSLVLVLLILGAGLAWPLWLGRSDASAGVAPEPTAAKSGLPWQIETSPDGRSQVFGLRLGQARLQEVVARFPEDLVVGLVAPHGQAATLEAYVESFRAGFVTGKLVLAFEADPAWLEAARARAPRNDVGQGGRSRRYTLADADAAVAMQSRLLALAFLPSARLDEAVVTARFGVPAERLLGPLGEVQLLYPRTGVSVALPPAQGDQAQAKAVVQYVAPAEFDRRLRAPLNSAQPGN